MKSNIKFVSFETIAAQMKAQKLGAFQEALDRLPTMVGQRNRNLLWICRRGIDAGLADEEIVSRILASSGEPPLGANEICRAIATVKRQPKGAVCVPAKKPDYVPTEDERLFVPRMIEAGAGTTAEGLQKAAGLLGDVTPSMMFRRHVDAMTGRSRPVWRFDIPTGLFWLGEDQIRGGLHPLIELTLTQPKPLPTFLVPNTLSGRAEPTMDGTHLTFRGRACVASAKLAIVEFDEMPLDRQLAFWGGVLSRGTLRVVSLTFSGGKSIHGLVEVGGDDYGAFCEQLERRMTHSDDPTEHVDTAPLRPESLTRAAGGINRDTGRVQTLLWTAS